MMVLVGFLADSYIIKVNLVARCTFFSNVALKQRIVEKGDTAVTPIFNVIIHSFIRVGIHINT
jgi:hypothetical protein